MFLMVHRALLCGSSVHRPASYFWRIISISFLILLMTSISTVHMFNGFGQLSVGLNSNALHNSFHGKCSLSDKSDYYRSTQVNMHPNNRDCLYHRAESHLAATADYFGDDNRIRTRRSDSDDSDGERNSEETKGKRNIESNSLRTAFNLDSNSNKNAIDSSEIESSPQNVLRHVAYIVDGNGRWAIKNKKRRSDGHNLGANVTVEIVKESFDLGIQIVTLYLFSTENWKRSNEEIVNIMFLLEKYLRDFSVYLKEKNIRIRVIGQKHRLSDSVQLLLNALETSQMFNNDNNIENQRTLCLAVSYGGRDDIIETTKKIADLVASKKLKSEDITEELFSKHTMTGLLNLPDPDIIIRTSGELRLSNFLLWQAAYTEFEFIDKLWPDFTVTDLRNIVVDYRKRKRRFGGVE